MKRLMMIICVLIVNANYAFSQPSTDRNDILSFVSGEQKLVRSAIDSSLCIVMQEYVLADSTGKKFVRDDKNYFGRSFTLGIITDRGLYTSSEILYPWNNDKAFDKFKNKTGITPVLSKTFYKSLYDIQYKEITDTNYSIHNDSSVVRFSAGDSTRPIHTGGTGNDLAGWIILLGTKVNPITKEITPGTVYVMKPQKSSRDSSLLLLYVPNNLVPDKEDILGGAYFTWKPTLGCISFFASGIVKKNVLGWFVKSFEKNTAVAGDEKLTLTPLK